MAATYSGLTSQLISAGNGVDYAYRDTGSGGVPLILLQHSAAISTTGIPR